MDTIPLLGGSKGEQRALGANFGIIEHLKNRVSDE